MSSKFSALKSMLNRPMRKRTVFIGSIVLVLLEVAVFGLSFAGKSNPIKAITSRVPYITTPTPPTELTTIYGNVNAPLLKPMAMTMVNRRIYVSDTNNQRIQVFDYDGHPMTVFGSNGQEPGQLRFPYGIAADSQGQIYVTDLYNGNISVFAPDGTFIKYFGDKGDFSKPAGLVISGNKLYLTDVGKNQVMVYSLDGNKLLSFGKQGSKEGELASPNCLAVANGKIYVSDTGNDRVEVFDEQGNFLLQFNGSTPDNPNPKIINPRGIGVDPKGIIYVVSNLTGKVIGFNMKGEPVVSFGSMGSNDDQFQLPNGLTIDDQGRIYVTDTVNGRLAVYQN
ncbi:MAG: SMP-30/gluconolactonase/LRE family protein [Desulfitobacteriaceae bacterium]|nr:SMP-30/gluconolactonase/LRE family protein [Desulfitobacteriaceae bacterium]